MNERAVTTVTLLGGILLEREDAERWVMSDQSFITLMVIGGAILVVVAGVAFAVWLGRFRRELRHLNLRIAQAVSEREKQHYLRRRRSLWWSLVPFVKYKSR